MATFLPLTTDTAPQMVQIAQARCGFITELVWSPDGQTMAVAHGGGVMLWQRNFGGAATAMFQPHAGPVKGIAFSPDGFALATGSADTTVKLCVVPTGATLNTLRGHESAVEGVSFSKDGTLLASCSADTTVRVLDMRETARRDVLRGHMDEVTAVRFGGDNVLASSSRDKTVRLWSGTQERGLLSGHTDWVRDVSVTSNGRYVASSSRDGSVRVWDVTLCEQLFVLPHEGDSRAVAFSPDGSLLASDDGGVIHIWDADRGTRIASLQGHSKPVLSLAFHPNGRLLASGSGDNTIRLWGVIL